MKKIMLFALILMSASLPAYTQDYFLSAGAGVNGSYIASFNMANGSDYISADILGVPNLEFNAFFDATYVMLNLGYSFSMGGSYKIVREYGLYDYNDEGDITDTWTYFNVSLYLKYPFGGKGKLTFFPLLGVDYRLNLTYVDENGDDLKKDLNNDYKDHLNQLWIKAGFGMDIDFGDRLFLRPMFLVGYKIPSQYQLDWKETAEDNGAEVFMLDLSFQAGVVMGFRF